MHILLQGDRQAGEIVGPLVQHAENARLIVQQQRAAGLGGGKGAPQLPRRSSAPPEDAVDVNRADLPGVQGHDLPGVNVADAVAQTGEGTGFLVVIGDGSDPGGGVPHPVPPR